MNFDEANELIKTFNLAEEDSLTYKAAIIFYVGIDFNWDVEKLFDATPYNYKDINEVLKNWKESEILKDGKFYADFEDESTSWMEFILVCMCGGGEIVRFTEEEPEPKKIKMSKKTLNDHLFEQLERISDCAPEDISTEIDRTNAMIAMAEQILNVAHFKMEVIQANSFEQFSEIDIVHSEVKHIENNNQDVEDDFDKKKLE